MTIIASLELKRYGVRANCIGPGGATRMVAQAMKIDVKNPEDYTEFEAMNPGNSAPGVVWLASDESLHVTGQVLRLVGNNLALYQGWTMGEQFLSTEKDGSPKQWDPSDIGRILNRYAFGQREPGHRRPATLLTRACDPRVRDDHATRRPTASRPSR